MRADAALEIAARRRIRHACPSRPALKRAA